LPEPGGLRREAAAGRPQPATDERAGRVPLDVATVSFGATHLLAVALTPDGPPRLVDLGEAARSPICNGAWSG